MVDSGSDISIIKAHKIKSTQIYFPENKCSITGIGAGTESSLGDTNSNIILNEQILPQKFHIVKDNFPIPTDGILGRDFLTNWRCSIDYDTWLLSIKNATDIMTIPITNQFKGNFVIPPRCEVIRSIKLDVTADYVTIAQQIQQGVFCANGIVNRSSPYVKLINTTENMVQIPNNFVPKLQPITNYEVYPVPKPSSCQSNREQALLNELNLGSMDPKIKTKLEKLCLKFNDVFSLKTDEISANNFYKQKINVNDPNPIFIRNYRIPESQKQEMDAQVQQMLKDKIIQNSISPYNNPILLVPKKSTTGVKKWRLVVDFRQLNKRITPDKFPLPRIDEILDQLGRARYFTTLDLMSGFHQIPLTENSKHLTAFSSSTGHYEFNRLPFGLNISPNSFQRMMTIALSGLPPECAFLYIDDIIVIGCSIQHHISNLQEVFQCLRKHNLKLNPSKCQFFRSEVTFLGHHVSDIGIQPDKNKYETILNYPEPTNSDETRRFVAFCNYYRRFIPNFAHICSPLNMLLRKNVLFKWNTECQEAFKTLKACLISPNILQYPNFREEFILTTDASKVACGAVLAQIHNGTELPVSFASKMFTKGESNKSTIEKELTAIHWAVLYFRPYLYGRQFTVRTDHRPLVYLFSMKEPSSKLTQMRLDLEEYDFKVEYIKGKTNVISDALSRVQINTESLKNMYVTTRAMTKEKKFKFNTQQQEPDQLHVYETLNNYEAFELPKLSFWYDMNNLNILLYKKNFTGELVLGRNLQMHRNKINMLQQIFRTIEASVAKMNERKNKSRNTSTIQRIAIAKNDNIFNLMDMNSFKELGNTILRSCTILIYEKPKILTNINEIENVLKQYHNTPIGGHLGINRLYKKIKAMYSWLNMKQTISEYVKSCSSCLSNKHFIPVKTRSIITTTPIQPFDVVSIDTVGPFPLSVNGNRYALTMQCDFTKYVIIAPITDKSASTVARAVVEKCILANGPMKNIKTDQGTEFKAVFDEVCKMLNITHKTSAAYHPQTIGALERNHRCFNQYLRIFCNDRNSDWDNWIPYYSFCYNTTPNLDHNYTPFELLFGRKTNTFESMLSEISPLYNHEAYDKEMKFRLQVAHANVLDAIQKSKIKHTIKANENIQENEIKVNDVVYLKLENRNKLDKVNEGPYRVIQVEVSNVTINDCNNKCLTVHKSRLVKFK